MATGFNTQVGNGEYRLQFETDDREYFLVMQETAQRCVDGGHMTNADRIRSMSNEELVDLLDGIYECHVCAYHDMPGCRSGGCRTGIVEWLQQPAENTKEEAKC